LAQAPAIAPPAPPAPAAPAPAAANTPTYGPPIAGLCLFARDVAMSNSQAGVSVLQQLKQLSQSISGQLSPQRDAIAKEEQALLAQKAKLTPARAQQRAVEIQEKAQAFDRLVQTRNAQIAQTRDGAMEKIASAMTPMLVASITAHKCAVLFERNSSYGVNPAMDLTGEIIDKLNAAMPTVTVTLAPPPTGQAQR
jgi:outer membrane protein